MPSQKSKADLLVVGGGIVGLATAYQFLCRFPQRRVVVLEKESAVAQHQTGRNSGVIHSGIYYKPGSLKARNCTEGKRDLEAFCQEHEVPFETCGKVIVAVEDSELPALAELERRGGANGVECEAIGPERLAELEPHVRGVRALHVPVTGIIDYTAVCEKLVQLITAAAGRVVTNAKVCDLRAKPERVIAATTAGDFEAEQLVNCGGLQSDRIAAMSGQKPRASIVPFRGEYFELTQEARHLVRNLIYPVPDPKFPFLGVHFTRMIDGSVECGPNAVLAMAREGYEKTTINPFDLAGTLTSVGFLKLAARHWRMGAAEVWRSMSKPAFVQALQRLLPDIRSEHLRPAPAGVRAQAVTSEGALVDDFLIEDADRVVNVLNAPSPAATASLKIGEAIAARLAERFD